MDQTRRIWAAYVEAVGRLGEVVADTAIELDERTRAEGLRHLTHALYMGMLAAHDFASTTDPRVFLAKTPAMLTGGVTSDCIYHELFFDGSRPHRLRATRGTAPLIELTANAGRIGITGGSKNVDSIREDSLVVESNANGEYFEIVMSPEQRPPGYRGNWLWTDHPERGRATWMLIRQYATDVADVEPARFEIELLDAEPHRSPTTLATVDDALQASVAFADRLVRHWTDLTAGMITGLANEFLIVDEVRSAGEAMPTGHRFSTAGFRLEPDEAWIVTIPGIGRAPYDAAPYWGFQLCNYWFEPLDYGATWAHRNKDTAVHDDDGTVRLVVSEQRPGPGHDTNWVQLRGYRMGNAQFRLSRVDAPLPPIECEVVPIGTLR